MWVVWFLKIYIGVKHWNRSILAKYIWDLANKLDLPWVKWINSIYLKGSNIWNIDLKGDYS